MTITFNSAARSSTFADLFKDTDFAADAWYQLWTGNATGSKGNYVDTSAFNDEGKGWIKGEDLDKLLVDFAQADDTDLWVRNFDAGTGWEHGAIDFSALNDVSVDNGLNDDGTAGPGETGAFVRTQVTDDTTMDKMFNVENLSSNDWLRIWVGNEEGTSGQYLDTSAVNAYGNGWVQVDDLASLTFKAAFPGESKELWVTTWDEETGYAGWEHWGVTTGEDGEVFTLSQIGGESIEGEPTLMWGYTPEEGGIPVADLLDFLQNIAGLDLVELGLIDDDGVDPSEFISNITIGDITNETSNTAHHSTITIETTDGQIITGEASLGEDYMNFLSDLIFDQDGNSRLYIDQNYGSDYEEVEPIVLTPTQNNGGTIEDGNTTDGDDIIVAGRTELLHNAYIDGGEGYNTLEVDMKGVYAQPLQLLNIQQIKVQNLPNVYGDTAWDEYEGCGCGSSILDVSRAMNLDRLVITEGYDTGVMLGSLTIVGIRNGAVARLEGGFTQEVNLHYGEGLWDAVTLELNLGDTDEFDLNVAHNSNTLNLVSLDGENWIHSADFGGMLTQMNISGDAALYIEGDLDESFHEGRTANIDASENTGGVDLTLSNHTDVAFIGTDAGDKFVAENNDTVTITGGNGNNEFNTNDSKDVTINSGSGDDVITSVRSGANDVDSVNDGIVTINAGDGNNTIVVSSDEMHITAGSGNDHITIAGMDNDFITGDGVDADNDDNYLIDTPVPGALLTINTGTGEDTVVLGRDNEDFAGEDQDFGITALEGSVITGENISLFVENNSDLSEAALSGITSVTMKQELTLNAAQFSDIGAGAFTAYRAVFGATEDLHIVVTEDVTLSDLVTLADLDDSIRLNFEIRDGATLTLSAQELHDYVAEQGIDSTDGLNGKVVITDAGLSFDPFDNGDDFQVIDGGSLSDTFDASDDVTIIRTLDGFNRPDPEDSTDTLVIDSTGALEPVVISDGVYEDGDSEDEVITTVVKTLEIKGDQDVVFEDPLDLADNFIVDFSELAANLTLTLANFQDMTAAADVANQGEIIGNGTDEAPARINIELEDNAVVGAEGNDNGFKSSGVQTYVVTDIYDVDSDDDDHIVNDQATVFVCDNTEDLTTLGLRGNHDDTINFMQVKWGTNFLLEGDGSLNFPDKSSGDPNFSNIGTLNAEFFWSGASAQIDINNQGVDLMDVRALNVAGINISNATAVNISITDGDAVIQSINNDEDWLGTDEVETLTFVSANDVTLQGNLDIGDDGDGLAGVDASAVDGTFTLELTDDAHTNLSAATLAGIDLVVFGEEEAELTLSADQLLDIGADNFATADVDGDNGTLNITDLADQLLDVTGIDVGNIGTLTIADVDGVVTLDPATVLGNATDGVDIVTIMAETSDTTVEMTAEQFGQIEDGAPAVDAEIGTDVSTNEDFVATLVITDLAADEKLDLANVDVAQVIRINDLVAAADDPDTADDEEMQLDNLDADAVLEVAGGDNDLTGANDGADLGFGTVSFAADATLTLTAAQVEAVGVENFSAAEGVIVTLNITEIPNGFDLDLNQIADAGINIGTLTIENTDGDVEFNADATLGGADEIITPTWDDDDDTPGIEDTTLTLTAEQFNQLDGGLISGGAEVNINGLENTNDSDGDLFADNLIIDLSTINAPHGTITLGDDPVALDETSNLGDFDVDLEDDGVLHLATEDQADGLVILADDASDAAVVWLFETTTFRIDTTGYDSDIAILYVSEDLVDGQNLEDLWNTLESDITVQIVNLSDLPDDVLTSFSRTVVVEAFTGTESLTFDDQDEYQYIKNLAIELQGNTDVGDLTVDDTFGEGDFASLTITSTEVRPEGLSDGVELEPNKMGNIALGEGSTNELVDITLDTEDENDGNPATTGEGLALEIDSITFGSDDTNQAELTLEGENDITIGSVDISDPDLTLLTIDNNNTADVEIAGVEYTADEIYLLDTHVAEDGDALGSAGTDMIVIVDGDNDLTEAALTVESVNFSGDATLTLTAAQVAAIGVGNFSADEGVTVTLNISELGAQNLDLDVIQEAGINIGEITIAEQADVALNEDTTLGGADQITMLVSADEADNDTSLEMTAAQFQGFSGIIVEDNAGTENEANVTIDELSNDQADIDLSTIDVTGDQELRLGGTTGDDDVTLDAAADLADFTVILDDLDSAVTADDLAGQTIRFATAVQAERDVEIDDYDGSHGEADTNVIWLFNEISDTAEPGKVDTAGYDAELGRLWVNDELVDGENVEELFTTLVSSIYVRVVNTADLGELLPETIGFDRTVEVEAFTSLPGGLIFNDEDLLEHVQNLTLDLGGDVNMGDLSLDNILAADVSNDDEFETLTINSKLASLGNSEYLLPESFDPLVNPYPDGPNIIGDISSGATRDELARVTVDADEVAIEIQTISFSDDDGDDPTAVFTALGAEDITVKSLDTSDAEITALNVDATAFTGTLTVTGGSPAAAVANTETLTVETTDSDVVFGSVIDEDAATPEYYAGVYGPDLSTITVNTRDGNVDLGVLASIDGTVDPDAVPAIPGFQLNVNATGTGEVTVVLGEAVVDGIDTAPELEDGEVWIFDTCNLTITDAVTFNEGGTLDLSAGVTLDIEGDVDFTTLVDDIDTPEVEGLILGGTTLDVPADATLTLTAAQADGVTITGAGTVEITELEATPGADLSGIMTGVDDTGEVNAALDSTDDVNLTGDLGIAYVTISGDGIVDIAGTINEATFTVEEDATLNLTAAQADEREVDGEGTVNVADLSLDSAADLSTITTDTVNAAVDLSVAFTGDLGSAEVTVAAGADLQAEASILDGRTITGEGTVSVNDNVDGDDIVADLSNISTYAIKLVADANVGTITFPTLFSIAGPPAVDQTVTLTAAQADGQTIEGDDSGADGAVVITDLGDAPVDLTGIDAGTMTASLEDADVTLDAATDLGDVEVVVGAGETLHAAAAIIDGKTVTNAGTVDVTALEAALDADLSGITGGTITAALDSTGDVTLTGDMGEAVVNIDGDDTVTIDDAAALNTAATAFNFVADSNATVSLNAEQADGITTTDNSGAGTVAIEVTDLQDESGADLSGLVADSVDVYLDASVGDDVLTADANLGTHTVHIEGSDGVDGRITISDGADVDGASFGVGESLTLAGLTDPPILVMDYDLVDPDSVLNLTNIFGFGTLEYVNVDGQNIDMNDAGNPANNQDNSIRVSTVVVDDGEAVTLTNFDAGTFAFAGAVLGRHDLDLDESDVTGGVTGIETVGDGNPATADNIADDTALVIYNGNIASADAAGIEDLFDGATTDDLNFANANDVLFLAADNGANTYIWKLEDVNGDSEFTAAADSAELVVTLTGVADATDLTADNFVDFS